MLLLWPGWVRRKRKDDFGRIGPALFAGTNNSDSSINKISSTFYRLCLRDTITMMFHLIEWALVPLKICQTCLANGVSASEADGKPDVELEAVGAHRTAQVLRPLRSLDRHCAASSGLPGAAGKL